MKKILFATLTMILLTMVGIQAIKSEELTFKEIKTEKTNEKVGYFVEEKESGTVLEMTMNQPFTIEMIYNSPDFTKVVLHVDETSNKMTTRLILLKQARDEFVIEDEDGNPLFPYENNGQDKETK